MKYGDRYPRSNCIPSTISTSVSSDLASSTVMTPSLPTFCIACAIILPIVASPFDEIVPTCATSAEEPTFFARFSMSLTTACTAISMPRLRSIGFIPAATDLAPSLMIACASTVAVVVPSPARSFVFCATSRSIRSRASPENLTSLAAISNHSLNKRVRCTVSGDHAHDVGLLHDQEFLAVELDLCARPLAEQHAVARFQVDRNELAVLVAAAGADCNDL